MAIGAAGVVLLIVMVSVLIRGWLSVILAILGTAAVAGAFVAVYSALGLG